MQDRTNRRGPEECRGTSVRLLVAENSREIRLLIRAMFPEDFASIDEADDEDGAVRLLRERQYDAILVDAEFPSVRGAMIESIRAEVPAALPRLVLLAPRTGIHGLEKAIGADIAAIVGKPFEAGDLMAIVWSVAKKGSGSIH